MDTRLSFSTLRAHSILHVGLGLPDGHDIFLMALINGVAIFFVHLFDERGHFEFWDAVRFLDPIEASGFSQSSALGSLVFPWSNLRLSGLV